MKRNCIVALGRLKRSGCHRVLLGVLVCVALVGHGRLNAQAKTGRIRGQVTDSLGLAIARAEVLVIGTALRAVADIEGRFVLEDVPVGRQVLLVRSIGSRPLYSAIVLKPDQEWVGRIGLEPAPVRLPDLEVTGRYGKPAKYANTMKFDDFYRRRATGGGTYITRDEVDKYLAEGAGGVAGIIERRMIPGVKNGTQFVRCSGGSAKIGVWVNGFKINGTMNLGVSELLDLVNGRDVEAIEVYRGVATIPGEFLDDSCAAIVIWTKYN